jgi:hypothetical protein
MRAMKRLVGASARRERAKRALEHEAIGTASSGGGEPAAEGPMQAPSDG